MTAKYSNGAITKRQTCERETKPLLCGLRKQKIHEQRQSEKAGKKAPPKTLVVLKERWEQFRTGENKKHNATFWKIVSRSNRTGKTSDWPTQRLQWDFFEKGRERKPAEKRCSFAENGYNK